MIYSSTTLEEHKMYYWLGSIVSLFILAGCGSSDSTSALEEELTSDLDSAINEVTNDVLDTVSEVIQENMTDYSLITCEDDLLAVVELINEKRAEAQVCGTTNYPAVDALTWNSLLALAAEAHSDNMANYDFFSHTGLDNSTVSSRVTAQGYTWNSVAENIAAGYFNAQDTVDALMESEGHCKNIMRASVTEIGLACSYNDSTTYKTFWTQVFANAQ